MSTIPGAGDLALKTPIGTLKVRYLFEENADGLSGTATSASEAVPLSDITTVPAGTGGERVTWHQRVTRPIRLNLDFDVLVTGDTLTGHSRAGRLPRTQVSGTRAAASA